ncbi:SagB family peptide dehydrogenase [Cereibacter sphaeroides]|jgi:SagB-type dehydrogenase family enzyme|uniref:SagB family peptide dehydrogenase n=1 Tax=Cereibacter sphaeroides TaxID=1063 RepID=UPI000674346B
MGHPLDTDLTAARRQLLGARDLFAPSELFHENSKITASAAHFTMSAGALTVAARGFKRFQHALREPLPRADHDRLADIITARRSCRAFNGAPIALSDLSSLAYLAMGAQGEGRRCLPSAGGLYPLDLYVAAGAVDGLAPGLLHYDPLEHALSRLTETDPMRAIRDAVFIPEALDGAAAVFLITAVFGRSKIKYGERAYRFALMEAGHAMQNLLLAATDRGMGSCPVGGFIDDRLHDLIGIDGVEEAALYACIVGHSA